MKIKSEKSLERRICNNNDVKYRNRAWRVASENKNEKKENARKSKIAPGVGGVSWRKEARAHSIDWRWRRSTRARRAGSGSPPPFPPPERPLIQTRRRADFEPAEGREKPFFRRQVENRWAAGRKRRGGGREMGLKFVSGRKAGEVRTVENERRKISGRVENLWAAGSFPAFPLLRPGANYLRTLNCEFSFARKLFGTICSYRVPVCGPINSSGWSLMCVNASELIFVWAEGCAFISTQVCASYV